jgi:hypothetical protein
MSKPALQVQAIRSTDLRHLISQFHDALFDGILHGDRLADHKAPEFFRIGSLPSCARG